ncbi:DUF2304 family protein [Candidatus Woesearchaeota archaeon]|nr:DUF2304 family protein [Candidatus Woesearchaeota archaeon]
MGPIQIVSLLFVAFALSRTVLRWKDKQIGTRELMFWTIIWVGVLFVAFLPQLTSSFSLLLGVGRGVDLVIYLSIVLLFYLNFRIYVQIDNLERKMTKIVRSLSIEKPKKK